MGKQQQKPNNLSYVPAVKVHPLNCLILSTEAILDKVLGTTYINMLTDQQ